jgi:glycosyltransferase involved in cell wall biosynthesis
MQNGRDRIHATLVVIPAFNEQQNLPEVVAGIRKSAPGMRILIVSDGSPDRTAQVAEELDAEVLDLPLNLGVGGAVQAGFKYALRAGYRQVIRMDADGQHPPEAIPTLLDAAETSDADLILASRFIAETKGYTGTRFRTLAIYLLALFLSTVCRRRITDPTSGFMLVKRPLLYFFAHTYPADYPEPEALAMLRRHGYDVAEVGVAFRERRHGVSSIRGWGTLFHAMQVVLALLIDRMEPVKPGLSRHEVIRYNDGL